jgi:hypothetical protein
MDTVELARRVVERKQHERGLDLTTAGLIVQVADALSDENRAKLAAMDVGKAARICWKLVK